METELNFYALLMVSLVFIGLVVVAHILFYKRAQKDKSFIRTGVGGERVVIDGGAFVLPIVHEMIPINMQTLHIEIAHENESGLITKDHLRVDATAEFFLRVAGTEAGVSAAARAFGTHTGDMNKINEVFEPPCVAALRDVAAGMDLNELHQQRATFEKNVETALNAEFRKNGFELVSVSLTRLDQTDKKYFDPSNAFDAQGLSTLEQITSDNAKLRNAIAMDAELAIKQKNLDAKIKKEEMDSKETMVQNQRKMERAENDAETQRRIEELTIEKDLSIERAQQAANITQAALEREVSLAWMETNKVKAEFEKISEQIKTAREEAEAERNRLVEIISAKKEAERQHIIAVANADAETLASEAAATRYQVEAAGKRLLNEASNLLSNEQIAMQVKLEVVRQLPDIIRESVRPLENIEGIKIMHIDGLNHAVGGGGNGGGGLADQVVDSALRYRAQLPLIESLLKEVGLKGGRSLGELTHSLREEFKADNTAGSITDGSDG